MTILEVASLIAKQDELGSEFVALRMQRKRLPKGNKVRTPFGMCRYIPILQDKEGYTLTIFTTTKQLRVWIKKYESHF